MSKKSVLTSFCKYPVKGSSSTGSQSSTAALDTKANLTSGNEAKAVVTTDHEEEEEEDHRPIPGAFPTPPSKRKQAFVFGSSAEGAGISNNEFGLAGDAVLEEMNRKLRERGIASIGQTLSKEEILQKRAKEGRSWTGSVGGKHGPKGRFEDAHARQFAR